MLLSDLLMSSDWVKTSRESASRDRLRCVKTAVAKIAATKSIQIAEVNLVRRRFLSGIACKMGDSRIWLRQAAAIEGKA
jgi:hypothetical protein